MFASSISIIRANWLFYLLFSGLVLFFAGLAEAGYIGTVNGIIISAVWLTFARLVHRSALFPISFSAPVPNGAVSDSYLAFVLKGLLLFAASLMLSFPFLLLPKTAHLTASQAPEISDILPFGVALFAFFVIVMSVAGTWLAAGVYGQNKGLRAAVKRGLNTFLPVFVRISLALFAALALHVALMMVRVVLRIDPAIVRDGAFNPGGAAFAFVGVLIDLCSITLISTALCQTYLRVEGRTGQDHHPAEASR